MNNSRKTKRMEKREGKSDLGTNTRQQMRFFCLAQFSALNFLVSGKHLKVKKHIAFQTKQDYFS